MGGDILFPFLTTLFFLNHKILEDYQPSTQSDAEQEGQDENPSGTSAGFAMMQSFLAGSAVLLRKALSIVGYGVETLTADRYTLAHGTYVEECVLLCLKVRCP